MEQVIEIVKKHPIAIGGGVVLLLVLMMRGGVTGDGNSSLIAAQLKSQEVAAQTDLGLASIQESNSKTRAQFASDIWQATIGANAATSIANNETNLKAMLGFLSYDASLKQIQSSQEVADSQIAASQKLGAQKLNADITMNRDNSQTYLTALAENLGFQAHVIASDSSNLPMILAYQSNKDALSAQTQQAIASIQTQAANTAADTAAKTASHNSDMDWVKTAASIASFFF